MITCPNKNLPEWLELERVVPELAYTIWDNNNGYGIDKAPNGEPSKLFSDLLEHFNGDREATLRAKSKVYSTAFKSWFGDWLNPFSQIRGFNIIFGHPAIGKTTALQGKYKNRFIDWDVEYNEKRDRWIEEHTKTKKGTKEFKNARNLYLIYPENHPDYIEFLTEEWNRVKNKAKQEDKILLASPHTLLKLFPNDFNYIIDVESNDFISRNINSGGNETGSKLWKEGIDKTVSNITNIPKYTIKQGIYLSDLLDDADNVSKVVDENGEPLVVYRGINDNNYSKPYAYFTNSKNEANIYSKGLLTKGGQFFTNHKDTIFAIENYIINKYNINKLDIDSLISIIEDYENNGKEFDIPIYENVEIDTPFGIPDIQIKQVGSKKEKYISNYTENEYNKAWEDYDKLRNANGELKELLDTIHLIKDTTITDEGQLTRQYDDVSYIEDKDKLNKLLNKYSNIISNNKSNFKPDVQQVFLNIKNPYIDEINSEDLLSNNKAYSNKHDGAFLMSGDHYLVKNNSNQIKSIDNQGTFDSSNNIYNRESNYNSSEMINNHIDSIKEIGTSNKLIEYIDTLNDVSPYMKLLLNRMKKMSTNIEIHPTATSLTLVALYNPKTSTIHLFADVISSTSNLELADSVAHELLHHYLAKMYYTDETFKEEVDRIRDIFKEKLGKDANKWYGFRDQDSSDEALNEIMSNSNLRLKLQETDKTLWDKLVDLFRKYILGEDIKENNDLKSLTETINSLIDHINTHDIDIYVNEQFKEMLMNKLNTNSTENNNELLTKIVKGLLQRLESIKRYTKRNIKSENELQELITKLSLNDMLLAVPEFVDHINDSIDSASKFLNKSIKDINPKQIRLLNEDYIGFYKPLLDLIKYELDTSDTFKDIPDLLAFTNMVDTLLSQMTTINNKFANISKAKAIEILSEHLENVGAPLRYIDETISWINNPNNDGNFLTVWAGMSSESNNQIVASIANMIVNTNNKTARFTYEQGAKLMPILDAAKLKHGNKVLELLYEKLLDGTYSGLLVRDINYGLYKHNFKLHLSKLSEELGIKKDNDGNYILPEDEKILNKWYDGINKFYEKHIERKYLPEYYALRNKILSAETRTALDEVNGSINQLLDSTVSEDGVIMENLLSPELKARLESLRRTKKLLGVEYNLDGTPKSGSAGRIASEIRKFNEEVGSDNNYVPDYDKFNADDKKVAAKYGKNSKEYTDWYKANTITRNNEAFYERLLALGSVDLSDDYKLLTSKRQLLLNIYKDPHTQDINVDEMSDKEKQMLVSLDLDIADIYLPGERVLNDEEDKFSDFAEVILTDKYLRDYRAAQASGLQIFDDWFMKNHYEDYKGRMKPAKYYTKLVPVQSLKDQYTETIPYGRYSKLDENSKYYNKNYINGGLSVQPKKSLYDNSKLFDVINSSKELKNLYDTYIKTKLSFDNMLSFMSTNDVYRMPLISARTLQAISRSNGVLSALKYVFEDVATTKEDDTDYVLEFATKPNGKPLRVVPTRYIRMLKNTNNVSTDAIGSLIEYGNMAANYVNMTELRDLLELLLNILENSKFTTKTLHKDKGAMNYYQLAQLLVDRLVYGKNKVPMKFTVGKKEINASKILDITRDYVSKVNLSYNMWSIGTSLLTDIGYTTLESTLGRFFNTKDLRFATTEFSSLLPYILSNTGNPTPNNKITYLMQLNLVVRDNKEIYERLDLSAAVRAMNLNFWFAGYTQADYTVKGHTTVAIYHNYKFVKGVGFMSENQYLNKYHKEDRKTGKVKFSLLPISLYDAYIEKDGKWAVDDKYKQYVTESLMNNVKNRIDILTRRVDGTLRDVDKAKIHTNSIAAYVTQHRNFMIQGMHNRFKGRTFNQDLGVEEEGYYRGMTRFLKNIIGQKHFALSQLLADYDKLEEFELYSVRKVTSELMMVSSSTLVALTIASLVDGDDDYDNWLSEAITYLALRSAFEFRTMYNPMELMSMIKSPTAAFSWFDNTMGMFGIFNPFSYIYAKSPLEALDRGVYKGFPRIVKSLVKATPIKNIIEALDPKIKRNYLLNQLMSF